MTGPPGPTSPRRDIQVLVSTYNGAAFVGEQLASLRQQTVARRIAVLVRDDGSVDDTVAVVRAFEPGDLSLELIEGDNMGVQASFQALLGAADRRCRVFLPSDQDDVWLPEKVEVAAAALADLKPDSPALYCGRSIVTDRHLGPRGLTNPAPRGPSWRNSLIQNIAPGHTMAFNRPLLDLAAATLPPEAAIMHDHWLYALAAGLGHVVFDPVPHALYRGHGNNEIGYAVGLRGQFERILRVVTLDRSIYTRQDRGLAAAIADRLAPRDRAALEGFLDQGRWRCRLTYLLRFPLVHQSRMAAITCTVLFALGRYRDQG